MNAPHSVEHPTIAIQVGRRCTPRDQGAIGGSAWESNPPSTEHPRPNNGFEDRRRHQPPSASVANCSWERAPTVLEDCLKRRHPVAGASRLGRSGESGTAAARAGARWRRLAVRSTCEGRELFVEILSFAAGTRQATSVVAEPLQGHCCIIPPSRRACTMAGCQKSITFLGTASAIGPNTIARWSRAEV